MNVLNIYQTTLNQWIRDYQSLHEVLCQEQNALEKRDFKLLDNVTEEKNRIISLINDHMIPDLDKTEVKRSEKVVALKDFKDRCESAKNLQDLWNELTQIVIQCQFKNEVNARMVSLLSTSTKRTFNLIKGMDPESNVYTANGESSGGSRNNSALSV
ncbi:MAG: flagellar protein FlgN [Gammaproteobacteria bacterium]|nr:flagellar protein FlgN [Gammaproteobacteria bacterium]MDH5629567.1 flagellar protein FlgN [Gammaproteobacteria bacterium]